MTIYHEKKHFYSPSFSQFRCCLWVPSSTISKLLFLQPTGSHYYTYRRNDFGFVLGISFFKRNSKPAQKFSKCQSGFSSREKEIFLTGFSYEYKTSSTFIKLKHKRYLMTWTKVLFTIQLLSLMDFFSLPFACKWHEFGISLLFSSHSTLDGSFPCCPRDHPSFQCAKMGGVY